MMKHNPPFVWRITGLHHRAVPQYDGHNKQIGARVDEDTFEFFAVARSEENAIAAFRKNYPEQTHKIKRCDHTNPIHVICDDAHEVGQ